MISKLPTSGSAREALREKGQFWTPPWVAQAMVAYVLRDGNRRVFDPAVGAGAFLSAAKTLSEEYRIPVSLSGCELHAGALDEARRSGLTNRDLGGIQIRDFALNPPDKISGGIVANPPYIRHHRLSPKTKKLLRDFCSMLMGTPIDGRAGLHVYFLLRALQLLEKNARLAFIMPADTCEGVFAPQLWKWICARFCLEAVITFAPSASPFPRVDTNAVIFMIRNSAPHSELTWARCVQSGDALKGWVGSNFKHTPDGIEAQTRDLSEALETGLSRPRRVLTTDSVPLGNFASVRRGIASGANEFFFLTKARLDSLRLPREFFVRAIGRTRDVQGDAITTRTMNELERAGRPTWLLSPGKTALQNLPRTVQAYLEDGEASGLPKRALIASRNPWYKTETREPPPFLFAYLGRRSARFIRNDASVVPLTGFLCVYPHDCSAKSLEKLWRVLNHPQTIENLKLVGKSYGDGAIKVEPRALERLPLHTRG
jgi:adenine-specific DNA-methyltransferase